jgi:ParB/RepB/Spo0J family partition protein
VKTLLPMSDQAYIELLELSPFRRRGKERPITAEEIDITQEFGLSKPILVRNKVGSQGRYEILQGVRDWHLAQRTGMHKVPIKILHHVSDDAARRLVDAEAQREGRGDPIEEALQIQELQSREGLSLNEVVDRLGQTKQTLSNRLRLLRLCSQVKLLVREGRLNETKARALVGLPAKDQILIADRATLHGLSTRKIEALARSRKNALGTLQKRKNAPSQRREAQSGDGATNARHTFETQDPNIRSIELSLGEKYGCAVSIEKKDGVGWSLTFECGGLDELDGVLDRI